MKEIQTVYLRKFRIEDAEILLKKFNDPEIISKMDLGIDSKELTLEKEIEWIKKTIEEYAQPNRKNFNWVIMTELNVTNSYKQKKIEELVGGIGAHTIDYENREAEICYWIGKHHQGKGYATNAIKIFCNKLFGGFKKINAEVFDHNIASRKVLEKAGFYCREERLNQNTGESDFFYEIKNPLLNKKFLFKRMGIMRGFA